MDNPKNWLSNADLTQGTAHWEVSSPGCASLEPARAEGRPAVRLERPPNCEGMVAWYQAVSGLPARRQVALSARARVEEGEAQLWVRCRREDGTDVQGYHMMLTSAARAGSAPGWQTLFYSFTVPPDARCVEIGAALPGPGRAAFSDFHLRLMPDDEEALRTALVETLVRQSSMPTAACRRAFLRVPRHRFVPGATLGEVYLDVAIPTHLPDAEGRGPVSSSSQPGMMATMLGQLRLRPGLRVLEIGAGTGYNAALLAEIVGPANVTSVDLEDEIVAEARAHLDAAGYPELVVAAADGWEGYPPRAPYDRIIATVGVADVAPAWLDQLREGGVLLAPFSFGLAQIAVAFRKRKGRLLSEQISYSFFMDLHGNHPRQMTRRYGDRLAISHDALDATSLKLLDEILNTPAEPFPIPEMAQLGTDWRAFQDLWTFVSFNHPLALGIADPRLAEHGIQGTAYAIADPGRRQVAVWGPNLCFGGPEIGQELRGLVQRWLETGRPGLDRLVLAACPRRAHPARAMLPPGRWMGVLEKEHTWVRWRYR